MKKSLYAFLFTLFLMLASDVYASQCRLEADRYYVELFWGYKAGGEQAWGDYEASKKLKRLGIQMVDCDHQNLAGRINGPWQTEADAVAAHGEILKKAFDEGWLHFYTNVYRMVKGRLVEVATSGINYRKPALNYKKHKQYERQWIVIVGGAATHDFAQVKSRAINLKSTILLSNGYEKLNPGWFIVVTDQFDKKSAAKKRVRQLQSKGIDCYYRYTGQLIKKRVLPDYNWK